MLGAAGTQKFSNEFTTKKLTIVDDNGNARGSWSVEKNVVSFKLLDNEGKDRLEASVNSVGPSLYLKYPHRPAIGMVAPAIKGKEPTVSFAVWTPKGKPALHVYGTEAEGSLSVGKETLGTVK
jgi:hypothetical protein